MMLHRERQTWRCSHCLVHGSAAWAVRDGPNGPRVSMLMELLKDANCGSLYAIIAVSCMNVINGFHLGRRTCISRIYLLGDDDFNLAGGPKMKPCGWAIFSTDFEDKFYSICMALRWWFGGGDHCFMIRFVSTLWERSGMKGNTGWV